MPSSTFSTLSGPLAALAAGLVAAGGWGWVARRVLGLSTGPLSVTMALGVALFVLLGGVLNLARFAFGPVLDLLLILGVAAAAFGALRSRNVWASAREWWNWTAALSLLPLIVTGCFAAMCLTPLRSFNWHDDFERYFSYPVRMLATGTVAGNPLSQMGADTLGGQAFLQALVINHLPIEYLGSLDTGLGLMLCLALTVARRPLGGAAVVTMAAQLCLIAIDPQVVNVSSLFTTTALVLTASYLGAGVLTPGEKFGPVAALALVYAALLAFKSTNVVFVAAHFTSLGLMLLATPLATQGGLRRWAALAAWTAGFIVPWVATHAGTYRLAIGGSVTVPPAPANAVTPGLFSTAIPFYGLPQLYFTLVAVGAGVVATGGWIAIKTRRITASPDALAGVGAAVAGLLSYLTLVVILAPVAFGMEGATRYSCPILIGTLPAALLLLGTAEGRGASRGAWLLFPAVGLGVFILFAPSLEKRIQHIRTTGSPLAFTELAATAKYAAYNEEVLRGKVAATLQGVQNLVPPGEPIIVWVMAPFWLNFARNPIYNTDPNGLAAPWAKRPAARYILWQYRGDAMRGRERYQELLGSAVAGDRAGAASALRFVNEIELGFASSEILFNDGALLLLRGRD